MAILINEWLPNPQGTDAEKEWIELLNIGSAPENLSGWSLAASGGKPAPLSGILGPGEYLVFNRSATKLTLKNSGERLVLYDAQGKIMHTSAYKGSAPEGKSYARLPSGDFVFSSPTPGIPNMFPEVAASPKISEGPLFGKSSLSFPEVTLLALITGVLCGAIILFAIFNDEKIHKLLFGGDEKIR